MLGERAVTVREVIEAGERSGELREALAAVDARLDPARLDARRLGYALRKVAGRILGGRQLVRAGDKTKLGAQWAVRSMDRAADRAA